MGTILELDRGGRVVSRSGKVARQVVYNIRKIIRKAHWRVSSTARNYGVDFETVQKPACTTQRTREEC